MNETQLTNRVLSPFTTEHLIKSPNSSKGIDLTGYWSDFRVKAQTHPARHKSFVYGVRFNLPLFQNTFSTSHQFRVSVISRHSARKMIYKRTYGGRNVRGRHHAFIFPISIRFNPWPEIDRNLQTICRNCRVISTSATANRISPSIIKRAKGWKKKRSNGQFSRNVRAFKRDVVELPRNNIGRQIPALKLLISIKPNVQASPRRNDGTPSRNSRVC